MTLMVVLWVCLGVGCGAQTFSWKRITMDGSRTGVKASSAENVPESLGTVKGRTYTAPNGKKFRRGATREAAKALLAVQGDMADVKQVIAHSAGAMVKEYPESALSNWFVDAMMDICAQKTGRKVDLGILNFGGIRRDMPGGDIMLDDIMSMFPFKNNLCYVSLKGKDVRVLLDQFAASGWQVIGGARCVSQDGRLVSATFDGEPLDDEKVYGVMTISFLLTGGDNLYINRNALEVITFDEYVLDVILPYVKGLEAEGKLIEGRKDGRVQVLDSAGNPIPAVRI